MARTRLLALAVAGAFSAVSGRSFGQLDTRLPINGTVASGTASISSVDARQLRIDQSSDRAIINWQSFSVGADARVTFNQPSASAVALNRVTGTEASQIFGRLDANGQVFLSNPNGVLFARGASVNVGGLFATTLSIDDADFLAGRNRFYNGGAAGTVANGGSIQVPSGYAVLAGPQVQNDGIIVARLGSAALAAGDRVTLDVVGDGLINVSVESGALNALAINSGTLQADGGRVLVSVRSLNAALDTVINNSGTLRADSLVERNGEIVLDAGTSGTIASTGTIETDGSLTILQGSATVPTPTLAAVTTQGHDVGAVASSLSLLAGSRVDGAPAGGMLRTPSGASLVNASDIGFAPSLGLSIEGAGISLPPGVTAR